MKLSQLKLLVAQGEGQRLEFKRKIAHPEKVVREAVAFANAEGGILAVGVNDDLTIPGLKNPDEDEYLLEKALQLMCQPHLKWTKERVNVADGHIVLLYHFEEGKEKPYGVVEGEVAKVYIRVADQSVQASREFRQILRQKDRGRQYQFNFGEKERMLMQHLDRTGQITLLDFARMAAIKTEQASRTLVLLVLAGVLNIEPREGGDIYKGTSND